MNAPTFSRKGMLATFAALGASLALAEPAAASASRVAGSWKLETFDEIAKDGTRKPRFGPNPVGYLIYTPSGRMSATLSGINRPAFEPTVETAKSTACIERVTDFLSYAGTYEIRGNRVFHHLEVSVFTNLVGKTLEREFHLDGDTLTIRTITPGMWGDNSILIWKRA